MRVAFFRTSVEETNLPRLKREFGSEQETIFNDSSIVDPTLTNFEYALESFWNFKEWDRNIYMYIYAGLACIVFLIDTTRTIYFFSYTMKISSNIHNKMFTSLVRVPIKFFDENPSGKSLFTEFNSRFLPKLVC